MGFKINKVKADLGSYPYYMFLAPRKFGKTTWWYNLVPEAWGSQEKGLLISFGNEEGYHSLDGLQVEVAKEWDAEYDPETDLRGFVQIVDDIVENNDKYQLKGVCIDTLDTFVDVGTKEVLRLHRVEKKTPCKTLNEAFSGYGRGVSRLLDIMDEQLERLRSAGLAVFMLCHIKVKERTDMVSGDKFETITNNLQDNIYTHFGDAAQIVMVGVQDREINDGKILSEKRVVYLRGNSQVDAGGRFTHIKEKIDLDPRSFLDAFEDAVKKSIKDPNADLDKMKKEEAEAAARKAEIAKERESEKEVDREKNEILFSSIKENLVAAPVSIQQAVKDLINKEGYEKLNEELPTMILEKVEKLIKNGDL